MDRTSTSEQPDRSPLPFAANLILVAWMVVALLLTWWFLSINANAGDWQDVVNVVAAAFMVFVVVAVAVSWLIARYAFRRSSWRVLAVAFGPPLLVSLVPITFWVL